VDETAEPAEWGDELSAEGRMAAIVYGRNPSACMDSSSFATVLMSGKGSTAYVYPVFESCALARDHDGLFAR